jgi:hypothetical protein
VFSTDVMITRSAVEGKRKVIKVFYREATSSVTEEFETLNVGEDVIMQMRSELLEMDKCIIEKTKMGIWNVGYLPRH